MYHPTGNPTSNCIHENRPGEFSLQSDALARATLFNGGIRVFACAWR